MNGHLVLDLVSTGLIALTQEVMTRIPSRPTAEHPSSVRREATAHAVVTALSVPLLWLAGLPVATAASAFATCRWAYQAAAASAAPATAGEGGAE